MSKLIKSVLTALSFTGLSLAQMIIISELNPNSKALANPQNTSISSTSPACLQLHSDKKLIASVLTSKSQSSHLSLAKKSTLSTFL